MGVATTAGALRGRTLSQREREILERVAHGHSIEDISSELLLSPHTVRTHIKNILRKMGAHTRAHAVAMAISEGLIDHTPGGVT